MKMSFAMMKIEWHNDAASDSRSDARKILVYVLISLDGIFVSPKMFSYLPVLLSWSE